MEAALLVHHSDIAYRMLSFACSFGMGRGTLAVPVSKFFTAGLPTASTVGSSESPNLRVCV